MILFDQNPKHQIATKLAPLTLTLTPKSKPKCFQSLKPKGILLGPPKLSRIVKIWDGFGFTGFRLSEQGALPRARSTTWPFP